MTRPRLPCWMALAPLLALAAHAADDRLDDILRQIRRTPGNPVYLRDLKAALPAATNPAAREVSLAALSLGSLVNDDFATAQQARDTLARHFPQSKALAFLRNEDLQHACPACDGSGKGGKSFCPDCKGSRKCTACSGSKHLRSLSRERNDCPACGGTGRCASCGGSGREAGPCPRCLGAGRLWDKDEARRISFGLLQQYFGDAAPLRERSGRGATRDAPAP